MSAVLSIRVTSGMPDPVLEITAISGRIALDTATYVVSGKFAKNILRELEGKNKRESHDQTRRFE